MSFRSLCFLLSLALAGCRSGEPVAVNKKIVSETMNEPATMQEYRASYTKKFKLIHTRLHVSPDWKKRELKGEASIILKPYFYPADSLILNARGMEINEVALLQANKKLPLSFLYDSLTISIHLGRTYTRDESLTIFIRYVSKPESLREGGSRAITRDKGLYFINPDSTDEYLPTQLWTQGETESSSVWFPTIEDPSQKMTQEIYLTVDTAFTTLSNGLLLSSVNNQDGTKTDYWKQSLPAAPYLSMIAVGNYSVVKDRWKNIEVSYYVDPPYEKFARMIFGNTPEMLSFFSEKLGIPYVWEKYSQVVVHEYISGAMENNTAVIYGSPLHQDRRAYIDGNFEDYISHELSHHWFGNLVTCESWSNISLNESFANYFQYIWRDYKFGRDNADELNQNDLALYLYVSRNSDPPLFRSRYESREDVYDAISYNKGGRILHMLRNYVGDEAFYASLNDYLTTHKFSFAEVENLRMSFEKITGEDLNWFFGQWFYRGGHPVISISYEWNDSLKQQSVFIKQEQDPVKNPVYRLPLKIDVYYNGKKERKEIVVDDTLSTFTFNLPVKPDLINVDADKILLCEKSDSKSKAEYVFQFKNAPLYVDRYEAVRNVGKSYSGDSPEATLIIDALSDPYYGIRYTALSYAGELANSKSELLENKLVELSKNDSSSFVREKALSLIGKYYNYEKHASLIYSALSDSSYQVVAGAFGILADKDPEKAVDAAIKLEADSGPVVIEALSAYYSKSDDNKIDFYKRAIGRSISYSKYQIIKDFETYLKEKTNHTIINEGIDMIYGLASKSFSKAFMKSYSSVLKTVSFRISKKISELEAERKMMKKFDESKIPAELTQLQSIKHKLDNYINALN